MWHASVAIIGFIPPRVLPIHYQPARVLKPAKLVALDLIADVGEGETLRQRGPIALHARRKLSPAELATLDPAWCALPAIDIAGGGPEWRL